MSLSRTTDNLGEPFIEVDVEIASKVAGWMKDRGGVVRWRSLDLSICDRTWTGPHLGPDGKESERPHWSAAVELHITDPKLIQVVTMVKDIRQSKRPNKQQMTRQKRLYHNSLYWFDPMCEWVIGHEGSRISLDYWIARNKENVK